MSRWRGKTAVVTGAASGIGAAITRAFLKEGINVVGLDIQCERVKEIAKKSENEGDNGTLHAVHCDLTRTEDIEKAFDWVNSNLGGLDIMVNNAGIINYKKVIVSDKDVFRRLLNINVLAVALCIKQAVCSMRERGVKGHIFNINSVLGHEFPEERLLSKIDSSNGWNLYPSCKHATVALTHTVRKELADIKAPIKITSISPGVVKETDIGKHSPNVQRIFNEIPGLLPEDIANAVVYALNTRPEVQITELTICCIVQENRRTFNIQSVL